MKKILLALLFLIYLTLSITNQLQFSLLVSNFVPVRIFLILFILLAFGTFLYRERFKSPGVFWQFLKTDRIFQIALALLAWRGLSLLVAPDIKFGVLMLSWWASILAFYWLGSYSFKVYKALKLTNIALWGLFLSLSLTILIAVYQTIAFVGWGIQRFDLWGWQYPDGFRVPALMLDSNHLGFFTVACFFLVFGWLVSKKRYLLAVVASFVILEIQSLASSRSALIGLLVGSVVVIVSLLFKKNYKMLIWFVLALSFGLSTGFLTSKTLEVYTTNFVQNYALLHSEVRDKVVMTVINTANEDIDELSFLNNLLPMRVQRIFDASAKSHMAMLKASLELGLKNPILGVGYGNFSDGLKSYPEIYKEASQYDARGLSTPKFPSHTLWGEQLAETGFIGLALYTLLVMAILIRIRKSGIFFVGLWVSLLAATFFYSANEEFFWLLPFLGLWGVRNYEN